MKLDKYVTLLSIIIFCGIGTNGHADEINFTGTISEFTCAEQSTEQACLDLKEAISKLKIQQDFSAYSPFNKQTSKTADISIENTENQNRKVLVINYN
ncbi:hypothetical protein [Acinetobacter sp. YH12145]|uniref:hypothetical protein n=1 Tax=Acinetobacter sp. YH12145 TaxID=2601129 RepID=UPI0015D39E89|nr:hypothetical protein [Acinetobacter sp. YH12145]